METLLSWVRNKAPSDIMVYKEAFNSQLVHIWDIMGLFWSDDWDMLKEVMVASQHCSKSIELPVYYFKWKGM